MSHSLTVPLLLLYANVLHSMGWNSAAVITSVSSSIFAGLISTISDQTVKCNLQFIIYYMCTWIRHHWKKTVLDEKIKKVKNIFKVRLVNKFGDDIKSVIYGPLRIAVGTPQGRISLTLSCSPFSGHTTVISILTFTN